MRLIVGHMYRTRAGQIKMLMQENGDFYYYDGPYIRTVNADGTHVFCNCQFDLIEKVFLKGVDTDYV